RSTSPKAAPPPPAGARRGRRSSARPRKGFTRARATPRPWPKRSCVSPPIPRCGGGSAPARAPPRGDATPRPVAARTAGRRSLRGLRVRAARARAPPDRGVRVVLATEVYPPRAGGAGWSTRALALGLSEDGHDVALITTRP